MPVISPLDQNDHARWKVLARAYMAFYETIRTDAEYETLWHRITEGRHIHSVGARVDGQLVGIAHYLFHARSWTADVCYLQDLYVDESARAAGVGRALVEHVARAASERNSPRLYWLTHEGNATARALYDNLASHSGFIRYEKSLP